MNPEILFKFDWYQIHWYLFKWAEWKSMCSLKDYGWLYRFNKSVNAGKSSFFVCFFWGFWVNVFWICAWLLGSWSDWTNVLLLQYTQVAFCCWYKWRWHCHALCHCSCTGAGNRIQHKQSTLKLRTRLSGQLVYKLAVVSSQWFCDYHIIWQWCTAAPQAGHKLAGLDFSQAASASFAPSLPFVLLLSSN